MTILASDDFAGLGTSNLSSRTLNNALGGTGTRAWGASSFDGNGSGALSSASNVATALVSVTGANIARVRVSPTGSENMILWGRRDAAAPEDGIGLLLVGQTSLRVSSFTEGSRTDHQSLGITAPGTAFWMELEVNGLVVTCRILNNDLSVRNSQAHTFTGSVPSGGDFWGFGFYQNGNSSLFDDFIAEDGAAGDTTAPTVTSVSGTDTGSTSATVSASSTEAGPAWCVLTPTSTQPSQAQVEAGQDHTGSSTGVFLDTATLAIGANPAAFVFTGLTPGATYWPHVVAKDTATPSANVSLVESGPSFTMPAPDVIDPEFPPGTTLDFTVKTNSTVALTASADATDNIAVTGYEWSSDNGASYPFTSLTRSFTFTALADLTSYNFRCRAYDGAGNRSAHLSLTTSTYRDGDTAANIIANTAAIEGVQQKGAQYDLALTKLSTDWLSYYEVTPPTPSGGTLTPFADGSFTYVGPEPATWVIQAEVNMVEEASTTTITLYADEPVDEISPVISSPTGAALGANGAAGSFSTDEGNGTAYWITTANVTELLATVEAGNSQPITASGVQFVTSSGLTPETNYYNHFFQRDLAGNPSNVISSELFTTPAAGEVVGGSRPGEKTMHSCMKPAMYPAMNKG